MGDYRSFNAIETFVKGDILDPKDRYDVASASLKKLVEAHNVLSSDSISFLLDLEEDLIKADYNQKKLIVILKTLRRRIDYINKEINSNKRIIESIHDDIIDDIKSRKPDKLHPWFELINMEAYKDVRLFMFSNRPDLKESVQDEVLNDLKNHVEDTLNLESYLRYVRSKYLFHYWEIKKSCYEELYFNIENTIVNIVGKINSKNQQSIAKNDFALLIYLCYRINNLNPLTNGKKTDFKKLLLFLIQGKERVKPECVITDITNNFTIDGRFNTNSDCSALLSDSKLFNLFASGKTINTTKRLSALDEKVMKLVEKEKYKKQISLIRKNGKQYFNPDLPSL